MRTRSIALAACLLAAPLHAQDAEEGRGLLEGFLEDRLSSAGRDINIVGFQGALSSRATVERLEISDSEGIWLTVENATLDWNRSAVLSGRIEVNELTADRIEVVRAPITEAAVPDAEASGFSLPELPVSVNLGELSVARVDLGPSFIGQPVSLQVDGSASLAGGEGEAVLEIARLDGVDGRFALDASFANETGQLSLDLLVEEDAGGIAATLLQIPGAPPISLAIQGDDPIDDFTATIALATDGTPRLQGTVTRDAAEDGSARTVVDIDGDLRPLTDELYHEFLGEAVSLEAAIAQAADGSIGFENLDLVTGATRLRGRLELAPDGWPRIVDVTGRIASDGEVTLPVSGGATRLGEADLSITYDAARGERWAARIAARRFSQPGFSAGRLAIVGLGTLDREGNAVTSLNGTLRLSADDVATDDPDLNRAIGNDIAGTLDVTWSQAMPLRIGDIDLAGDDYRLLGDVALLGDEDEAPFASDIDLRLMADDLSRLSGLAGRDIGGAADLGVSGRISPLAGAFDLVLDGATNDLMLSVAELDGLIGGDASLRVSAARDETGTRIEGLDLDGSGITLRGDATYAGETADADLTVILPDLSRIRPELSGQARLQSALDLADGRVTATVDLAGPGGLQTVFAANAPFDPDTGIGAVDAEGRIAVEDLAAFAEIAQRPVAGRIALTGTARFDPETGALSLDAEGNGRNLSAGIDTADRVLAGQADLSVTLARDEAGAFLIDAVSVSTPQLDARASGRVGQDSANVDFNVRLANLAVIAPEFPGPLAVEGDITREGTGQFRVDASGTGPGGVSARVNGTLAEDASTANLSINGSAPLALANSFIAPRLLSGSANFDLALNGPLEVGSLSGRVTSSGAGLVLPTLGLSLNGIDANVGLSRGRASLDIGAALSTGGSLRVTGPVTLSGGFPANLSIALNNLVLTEPGLYETTAAGSLSVDGRLAGGAAIRGQINLGETELRVPSGGGPEIAGLDIRHVNEPADVRASRARAGLVVSETARSGGGGGGAAYPVDIRIYAPNRIFVRGRGLDAELGGALRLSGTSANVITQGEFSLVRGRLDILGRRLNLTEALVRLQGDFDPFIRVAAESRTEDVLVRFVIEGPASEPELSITSQPSLPEESAMSLFLFGRNPEDLSAVQALRLAAAVRTLSGGGGEGIIGNLRESIGVDDLDIAQGEDGTVGVRAGKYISENIYSDVVIDAEGKSRVNLNLELSPSITARGSAGSDGSTGLGIFFERDY